MPGPHMLAFFFMFLLVEVVLLSLFRLLLGFREEAKGEEEEVAAADADRENFDVVSFLVVGSAVNEEEVEGGGGVELLGLGLVRSRSSRICCIRLRERSSREER